MLPFQERKKFRKILYSKTALLVLFVIVIFMTRGAWKIHNKAVIAQEERDETARSLADLQGRTKDLEASIVKLKSGQGVEEEVRQKFTVAKQGEEVVVVVDENAKKSKNGELIDQGAWARVLRFFRGQ